MHFRCGVRVWVLLETAYLLFAVKLCILPPLPTLDVPVGELPHLEGTGRPIGLSVCLRLCVWVFFAEGASLFLKGAFPLHVL
jgi:hypothetical protein